MTSGKQKLLIGVGAVIGLAIITVILLGNKAATQAKTAKNEIQTAFPVTLVAVEKAKLNENLVMVGTVYAQREVNVLSEIVGRVIAVNFDVGDRVGAGAVLAKVDDELKKAALINAEANYEKSKKDLGRYEQLYKEKSGTEAALDQAKLTYKMAESQYIIAKRQLADTKIVAPFAGTVTQRNVEVGTVLAVNNPVAYLVDIATVKVKVNVSEKDAFKMKAGDNVDITSDVYPRAKLTGKIRTIGAKADEAHSYPVEISIANNAKSPFKAGMIARISFISVEREDALVIPREAIVGSVKNAKVYVAEGDHARLKDIIIGAESDGKIEVLQGLNVGDMVVKTGQINLKDNAQIIIVKN